jgi:putative heme iron utilization protein
MSDEGFAARCLARAAGSAVLATQAEGQPFASLVTPACSPGFEPLLLLSSLSEHTRQLRAEPRCALLVTGPAEGANPQTAPRLTLTGIAAEVPAAEATALKARWLAKHPYAALYADFGDFALWRITPGGALLVGGFARAVRIRQADLRPDPAAVAAIEGAAESIIEHMNSDHAAAVAAIGAGLLGGPTGPWRMVGVDTDGADFGLGEVVRRLAWAQSASSAEAVRVGLIEAARAGRAGQVGAKI